MFQLVILLFWSLFISLMIFKGNTS